MDWRMAGGTWPAYITSQRSHHLALYFQSYLARFALSGLFRRREITIGSLDYGRVHWDGAGRPDLSPISQSQNGYCYAGSRWRLDVQRTGAGFDWTHGRRPGR